MTLGVICSHRQGREGTGGIPHVPPVGPGAGPSRGRAERASETAPGETGHGLKSVDVPTLVRANCNIHIILLPTTRSGVTRLGSRVDDSFYSSRSLVNFARSANFPLALTDPLLVTPRPPRFHLCSSFRLTSPFRIPVFPPFLPHTVPHKNNGLSPFQGSC
jgi:hypothetical protein